MTGSNETIASVLKTPFLVAPSVSTSMPALHVRSAGAQPSAASALASRAPSRWARSPRSRAMATTSPTCAAVYTVPRSVGFVSDSTEGCEWWGSPQRVASNACRSVAGLTRNASPAMPRTTAPPPNIDVAPHSLCRMCAVSWHRTDPHGGHSAASPIELAAVPLITGNTSACGCSNTAHGPCRAAVRSTRRLRTPMRSPCSRRSSQP